jgi:hypothetical protein
MLLIGALYAGVATQNGIPEAGAFVGHSFGVIGFLLMLSTETLYSLRKRSASARWGKMSKWMQFHIFTGIVGPFMVLLHTAWRFQGLAGAVTLMTVVVVLSGFVGRYIFTSVPRNADGLLLEVEQLEENLIKIDKALRSVLPEPEGFLGDPLEQSGTGSSLVLARGLSGWLTRTRIRRQLQRLGGLAAAQTRELERLLQRRHELLRQVRSQTIARRMLAVWHTIHIPLGMALFVMAFVHIGAALYYSTFLR